MRRIQRFAPQGVLDAQRPLVGVRLYRESQPVPPCPVAVPDLKQRRGRPRWNRTLSIASARAHTLTPQLYDFGRWCRWSLEAAEIDASLVFAGKTDTLLSHLGVTLSEFRPSAKWSCVGTSSLPPLWGIRPSPNRLSHEHKISLRSHNPFHPNCFRSISPPSPRQFLAPAVIVWNQGVGDPPGWTETAKRAKFSPLLSFSCHLTLFLSTNRLKQAG